MRRLSFLSNLKKNELTEEKGHTFFNLFLREISVAENIGAGSESDSTISCEEEEMGTVSGVKFDNEVSQAKHKNSEMTLLDLYSGCGAMSTGLCLGANSCGVNLVTVSLIIIVLMYKFCKLQELVVFNFFILLFFILSPLLNNNVEMGS